MTQTLPYINSEGGPILIGDYQRMLRWRGIAEDGSDYDMACHVTDLSNIGVIDDTAIAWDFGGPGSAYILSEAGSLTLLRYWADHNIEESEYRQLEAQIRFEQTGVRLNIPSGTVLLLWATEDGRTITEIDGDSGYPEGDFSMGGVAHFQKMNGTDFTIVVSRGEFNGVMYTALKVMKANKAGFGGRDTAAKP